VTCERFLLGQHAESAGRDWCVLPVDVAAGGPAAGLPLAGGVSRCYMGRVCRSMYESGWLQEIAC